MWRLSKLNIRGFKSFAEPAELVFPEGITAVVGPNGCGKSNISDAIVWALGEQSTSVLRAQRMNDVIFQGTAARRPTGTAEVTLHLTRRGKGNGNGGGGNGSRSEATADVLFPLEEIEQSQQEELSITRRLFRSGDSEYLLNGNKCLLRDVREKLLGTGLGSRACFTIGQGRIDQILSASPVERRAPIEEAAGISAYRGRRHRTNLKLEATALDLSRVEDICDEVARQMRSLKRQAGKARRYRELRDRLRSLEREWFSIRLLESESAMEVSGAALKASELAEETARSMLEQAASCWEQARRAWRQRRQAAAARRQRLYNAQVEHERAKAEGERQRDRAELGRQRLEELGRRVTELQARRADATSVVEVRREAAARADEAARAAERILQDTTEQLDPSEQLKTQAPAVDEAEHELELLPLAARLQVAEENRAAVALVLGRHLRVPVLEPKEIEPWLEAVTERRGLARGLRATLATEAQAPPDGAATTPLASVIGGDDDTVGRIVGDLLRNTWLVEDRDTALRLAAEHPEHGFVDRQATVWARGSEIVLRAETLSGDVIEESSKASVRLRLKRKGEPENQRPAIPSAEQEGLRLALERADAGLRAARAQSAAGAREAQAAEAVLRQQQAELERLASETRALERTVKDAVGRADAADQRLQETAGQCEALQAQLHPEESGDVAEEAEIAGLEAAVAAAREGVERVQSRRSAAQVEAAELRVARRHLQEQIRERLGIEPFQLLQAAREAAAGEPGSAVEGAEPVDGASSEGAAPGGVAVRREVSAGAVSDPLALRREIAEVRAGIDRLGPVNLVAYEDFQKQESRFHELDGQRRDLVAASDNLRAAIGKIDADCVVRFSDAFEAIDGYFNRIMRQLFGGGRAGMRLEDPDDPLNSGIEIVAQPPGKALQSIRLLSGGERSMIALALMFAIFEYHPSPFCILDEADAALDERNVVRFVQALNSFQDRAQFIMITHNKRSMEVADLLYGVTMEETGVSKLVSVALN